MKKLTSIAVLLLFLQLSAFAQSFTITLPDSIAGKNWVRNLIRQEIKSAGSGGGITPTEPTVPDPAIKPCPAGPKLLSITNVSPTYLNAEFHGDGVIVLSWAIKNISGSIVRDGVISPKNSKPGITYNSLPAGTYTLYIEGKSCRSDVSFKPFAIDDAVGQLPPVVVPPVLNGNMATIAKGMDEHMRLDWVKDGDGYLVSDLADPNQIGSAYEYGYMIGSDTVRTGKSLLKNYRISGFLPGRIAKFKVKPHLTLANWTSKPDEVNYFFSLDAGEGFSFNTSIPFQTYSFPGAVGDFVNPIPTNYNPALQNVQWGDIATDIKLPHGHVYVADPRPWGIDFALKKGVTHISNFALDWSEGQPFTKLIKQRDDGITYNDVPRIETVLQIQRTGYSNETWKGGVSKDYWPNWGDHGVNQNPGYKEGYEMGLRADISHALFIGEFSENISWLPPNAEIFRGFYDAFMPRMEERFGKNGIPYLVCHDYLLLGMQGLRVGRNEAKQLLLTSTDKLPATNYSPGGTLAKTSLIVETVYLDAIDKHGAQPYELIFKLNLYKHMGYIPGVFIAPVHEWRPNNLLQTDYKDGKVFTYTKVPLNPGLHIDNTFLSQVFGKVFVEWGGNGKVATRTMPNTSDWEGGFYWYPNGSNSPQGNFPHFRDPNSNQDKYYGYAGACDLSYFGIKLFAETYAKVEGGRDKFLRYRLDGGDWVNPSENDYIDAFYDKRAFVHSRTLNGKTAFFFINAFTDNSTHTLEVELPSGQKWTGKVAGNSIHAKLL